jgi:hypothetical protein
VLSTGASLAWAALSAGFYDVVETDAWVPQAPGPSGITYYDAHGTMLVVDSDRNNYAEFDDDGIDIWEMTLDGTLVNSWGTGFEAGQEEPTGIDYDSTNNRIFITDDDGSYYIFLPGVDNEFGTADDPGTPMPIAVNGSGDTEDPAYDAASNNLFVLDGGGTIFRLNPSNGSVLATIDLSGLGPDNWEGLALTTAGELLVGANEAQEIWVISVNPDVNGDAVSLQPQIGLGNLNGDGSDLVLVSGLGISTPGVGTGAYDIWVADRQGTSNDDNPGNIDGRVWRLSTDGTPPPPPSTTTTPSSTTTTTTAITSTTTTPGATTTTTVPGTTTTTQPDPSPDPIDPFTDDDGHIFENAIEWLAAEGITQGCNPPLNTRFCPDDNVTRGQMAAFLVRAFKFSDNGGGNLFTDDDSSLFENAIDRLATAGVTVGCNPPSNTRFCPDDNVTRGQMAAFLVRAFGYVDGAGADWFADDDSSLFENAIDRLRTAAVTQGCNPPDNTRYCPDQYVTRGQMAAFLKRAFGE